MGTEIKKIGAFGIFPEFTERTQEEIDGYNAREEQKRRDEFHKICGLDTSFFSASIDFAGYSEDTKSKLRDYVRRVKDRRGTVLIILGDVGTGKTSAAAAVMNELTAGTYYDMLELELKLDTANRYGSEESREQVMHRLSKSNLLVLDEVGRLPSRRNDEQATLFYLINRRFQNGRPTVIVTNMSDIEFSKYVGKAIIDRIKSNRIKIELRGKSLRGWGDGA